MSRCPPYAGGQVRIVPPPSARRAADASGGARRRRSGSRRAAARASRRQSPHHAPHGGSAPGRMEPDRDLPRREHHPVVPQRRRRGGAAAWRTMTRGAMARSRSTSAAPAKCASGTWRTKTPQSGVTPPEQVSSRFRMQRLNDLFYSYSAAAADFNRDGVLDVVAGPYIYFGPRLHEPSRRSTLRAHLQRINRIRADCWVQFAADFTGDGWPDVLTTSHSDGRGRLSLRQPERGAAPLGPVHGGQPDSDRDHGAELTSTGTGSLSWSTMAISSCATRSPIPPIRPSRGSFIPFPRRALGHRARRRAPATSTATGAWISSPRTGGGNSRPPEASRRPGRTIRRRSAGGRAPRPAAA